MKLRWISVCLLLITLPSILYAAWSKNIFQYENDGFGVVVFNHDEHFEFLGQRICTDCHHKIFFIQKDKNPEFTMKDMEEGKSCGACHNGEKAFAVADSCSSCHPTNDITFDVPDAGPVVFSHDVHTGMFGCSSCHPDLFIPSSDNKMYTMDAMSEGDSCGACHDDSTAFSVEGDCESCHEM
ncbi:MAG: cytochrome c3 family protein [Desulfuromusa sp.]|nr:cytochrome c3 family protein [Desulfuromusa sp.]